MTSDLQRALEEISALRSDQQRVQDRLAVLEAQVLRLVDADRQSSTQSPPKRTLSPLSQQKQKSSSAIFVSQGSNSQKSRDVSASTSETESDKLKLTANTPPVSEVSQQQPDQGPATAAPNGSANGPTRRTHTPTSPQLAGSNTTQPLNLEGHAAPAATNPQTTAPETRELSTSDISDISSDIRALPLLRVSVQIGLVTKPTSTMRHSREDPSLVLRVADDSCNGICWYVAKSFNQLKSLDAVVRQQLNIVLPQLPEKNLFASFTPIKIDVRIDMLNSYFSHLQEAVCMLSPQGQSAYANFISTNLVKLNTEQLCGFLVSRSRFSGWKPRYCVRNGSQLDISDRPGGPVSQTVNLMRARVAPIADHITSNEDEYRNGFSVVDARDGSGRPITHFFSAESSDVRHAWVKGLQDFPIAPNPKDYTVVPFVAVRDRAPSTSSASARAIPAKSRRRSSLTIDAARSPSSKSFEGIASSPINRMPSPSAIAITHHSSGPTSALAQRRIVSPMSQFPMSPATPSYHHKNVFGVSLDDSLGYSSTVYEGTVLPTVVGRCIEILNQREAYLEQGIFRISGTQSQVDALETKFEHDDVDEIAKVDYEVHVFASLLKRYFRMLSDSLIPPQEEAYWRDLFSKEPADRNIQLHNLLLSLPDTNYDILKVLIAFLVKVEKNQDTNKMTLNNLSIVFSPTLDIPGAVISLLIEDYTQLFS